MLHICCDKVLTGIGESRCLFAATYGLQDQSQQTVSDTAQQTLQMVVFAPQWPPEAAMQPYR